MKDFIELLQIEMTISKKVAISGNIPKALENKEKSLLKRLEKQLSTEDFQALLAVLD